MRIVAAVVLLAIGSPCYCLAQTSGPVSVPGCGPSNIEFNVKTESKQRPAAAPDAGKAYVYFLQDDNSFLSRPRPTTRFGIDGGWAGATHSDSYFYIAVDPGEHHLCSSWQGFVGLGPQRREAALHFTADAGGKYYFLAKNIFDPHDKKAATVILKALDSDEAELLIGQFSFSTSNPKK